MKPLNPLWMVFTVIFGIILIIGVAIYAVNDTLNFYKECDIEYGKDNWVLKSNNNTFIDHPPSRRESICIQK